MIKLKMIVHIPCLHFFSLDNCNQTLAFSTFVGGNSLQIAKYGQFSGLDLLHHHQD